MTQLPTLHRGEALAAVNGAILPRLEGHLRLSAAIGANGIVHFARAAIVARRLMGLTALTAAGGLILEALFSVEFLLSGCEHEFLATVTAHQRLVLIHVICDPLIKMSVSVG